MGPVWLIFGLILVARFFSVDPVPGLVDIPVIFVDLGLVLFDLLLIGPRVV